MNAYNKYIISAICYAICFFLGIIASVIFIFQRRFFLAFLGILFSYVSLDNFFCGSRARSCGIRTEGHYIIPDFLTRKTKEKRKIRDKFIKLAGETET